MDFVLNNFIMNASGLGSVTKDQIRYLDNCSSVDAVVSKTCTFEPRQGNPEPNYYFDENGSVNFIGLKNYGVDYYIDIETKKPYILSVTPDKKIFQHEKIYKPNFIEVNLSCPNIADNFDYEESIRQISETTDRKFGIKIAPLQDSHIAISDILTPQVEFITCCNTMKMGLIYKDEIPFQGAIGGKYIKPFSLYTVYKLRNSVNIPLIGCGGIECKSDVEDYRRAGASAFQVGTHYFKNGIFYKLK